jgi:peptidoglycan LD-endopeptidase LytH
MDTRLVLAWLHLLALGVGLAGVWARARALRDSLRDPEDGGALRRAFIADAWWGVAAVIWLGTGLWRLIGGMEKAPGYYMANRAFHVKMGLFLLVVALEVWPMITLIRWRARKALPNPRDAGRIEIVSYVQCVLVVFMVLAAAAMARGYGSIGASTGGRETPPVSAQPAATNPPPDLVVTPSGVETITDDDRALLAREITMPLDGIDPASLHSNFDERRGGGTRQHRALDIMAPRRTPVHAAASGRVLKRFESVAGGLMVYAADSSERFILMYAHLDGYAPGLQDGMRLTRGQLIGFVGFTGNAVESAPHLHFAVARSADVKRWSRGAPLDPLPALQEASRRQSERR